MAFAIGGGRVGCAHAQASLHAFDTSACACRELLAIIYQMAVLAISVADHQTFEGGCSIGLALGGRSCMQATKGAWTSC